MQTKDKVIDDFYYILHRFYNRGTRAQAECLYNQAQSTEPKLSDEKITAIANLLRQKENVVNE